MYRFLRATSVGLIAAAFMLAGCSGGSGGSPAAGSSNGAVSPPAAIPSIAPAASIADQGGTTATCKQLTFDEVQPLLDVPIKSVAVKAFGPSGSGQECDFDGADQADYVGVMVAGGSDGTAEYNDDVANFASPAPLPGVGDQAMWDKGNESAEFAALKGDVYCSVGVEAEDVPGVGALMDAANNTNNIGDANYAIISTALATLCNRIYGSGDTTIDLSGLAPGPPVSPGLP